MGLRDHVICDSDLHVMEPPDLWERYIDPAYAHAAPRGLSEITRDMRVRVKNNVMLRMGATRPQRVEGRKTGWQKEHDTVYAASEARGWDAQSQIDAMNAEGLDLAVLFPSRGLFVLGLDSAEHIGADGLEPEFATAIARAYNDWLKDFCDHAPDRMFGAGMVAAHDVDGAVAEARRCVEELGFKAIFLPPGTVNRRPWHHPAYDTLWAEIERLGVPLSFHGGGQTYLTPDFGLEVLDKLMLWHTFSQPLGIQFVTACLCGGGVLERGDGGADGVGGPGGHDQGPEDDEQAGDVPGLLGDDGAGGGDERHRQHHAQEDGKEEAAVQTRSSFASSFARLR